MTVAGPGGSDEDEDDLLSLMDKNKGTSQYDDFEL